MCAACARPHAHAREGAIGCVFVGACVRLCVLTYAFDRVRQCVAALCARTKWLQAPLLWYEEGAEARPRVSLLRALVTNRAPHLRQGLHHAGAGTLATSAAGSTWLCPGGARRDAARRADGPFRNRYDRAYCPIPLSGRSHLAVNPA